MNPYEDIINLPRHRSRLYPPMPREKRAAQFSPFAALSGHEEAIKEKARLTDRKIKLSEAKKTEINARLLLLKQNLPGKPIVTVTYFKSDPKKPGGAYLTATGVVTKILEHERLIVLEQGAIPMEDIYWIAGSIFSD